VAGTSPIPQSRPLKLELGRQVPVVAHLIQQPQHRGVDAAAGQRVTVELAHRGEHMVDPPRPAHGAPPGPDPLRRRRPEHPHEQVQVARAGKQVPAPGRAPTQEQGKIPGIDAGRPLGPVGAQPKVPQVGVGGRHRHPGVVHHGPVGERAGQLDPQRPHQNTPGRCVAQFAMSRTIRRRSDMNTPQRPQKEHPVTVLGPLKSGPSCTRSRRSRSWRAPAGGRSPRRRRPTPGDDLAHRAPRDPHQLGHRRLRRLGRQPGHRLVEGVRVARVMPRPRNGRDAHPMLAAGHPWRVSLQHRPDRAQVQRPPPPPTLAPS